jgi:hypothetical protein
MHELLVPGHVDSRRVDEVRRVPYEQRAREARQWAVQHRLTLTADVSFPVCLLAADVQNTFRTPGDELSVAQCSGRSAVDDNSRRIEFIYRNLGTTSTLIRTWIRTMRCRCFTRSGSSMRTAPTLLPPRWCQSMMSRPGRFTVNPADVKALHLDEGAAEGHSRSFARRLMDGGSTT